MKSIFKFAMTLSLITATFSAYAEGSETGGNDSGTSNEPKVVRLKDNTAVSWTDFVKAINNPTSIKGNVSRDALTAAENALKAAQDAVPSATYIENAKEQLKVAEDTLTNRNDELDRASRALSSAQGDLSAALSAASKQPAGWLAKMKEDASAFASIYDKYLDVVGTSEQDAFDEKNLKIFYLIDGKTLNLAFDASCKIDGMEEVGVKDFYAAIMAVDKIRSVWVYFGDHLTDNDGKPISNGSEQATSYGGDRDYVISAAVGAIKDVQGLNKYTEPAKSETITTAQDKVDKLKEYIATLNAKIDDYKKNALYTATTDKNGQTTFDTVAEGGKTQQTLLNDVVTNAEKAQEAVKTATENVAIEEKKYEEAVAKAQATAATNYRSVTLDGDVTATAYIDNYDAIVNINGNNHIITLDGITELFHAAPSSGNLTKVAVNGSLGQTAGVKIASVAYSNNNDFGYYDNNGAITKYTTVDALGFAVRGTYGVDFAKKALAPLTAKSIVYSIKVYSASNTSTTTDYFVQQNGTTLSSRDGELKIPSNTFIYSATHDLKGIANVFYDDNTCDEVVISDRNAFYCPVDIEAANMTFDRKLKEGYNTVCLPFDLKASEYRSTDDFICTYDQESPTKFWFNKINAASGVIKANTPALIYLGSGANTSLNRTNITIKATPTDQLPLVEGTDKASKAYGLFKNSNPDEIIGASNAHKIYGLQGVSNGAPKFNPASASATFPAFRMVIASEIASQQSEGGEPLRARSIGIRDEEGKEITIGGGTSSLEVIDMEDSTLDVVGGQGEIIITTDANYGEQSVYSLDGKVVATVNVTEGTTTVNVQSGVYVVMGQKVLVK